MDYIMILNYITDELAYIGDVIVENEIEVPEWMLSDYDTLQDKSSTLWATYADVEITECSTIKKEELFSIFDKAIYKVIQYLHNFEWLVREYMYCM